MGNKDYNNKRKKLIDNKNEIKFILTNNIISDISIFYNYEQKYSRISNNMNYINKKNYIFIICGLINGFIEIYNEKFNLILSFKAHKDIISKIIQLPKSGYLLTSSYDNSLKVFKLFHNLTKENQIYIFYLGVIFNRINTVLLYNNENNDEILILSVFNYIIYFPYTKNNLNQQKIYLDDYKYSKFEHHKNNLYNLIQINKEIFIAFDEVNNNLLFFKLIPLNNDLILKNIQLIKTISLNTSSNKICIENLYPKYNFIIASGYNCINIIDIKYMEIILVHEIIPKNFFMSYNNIIDRILIFDENNKIYKFQINQDDSGINFLEENNKINIGNHFDKLNEIKNLIYNPENKNIVYFFYKKFLMKIELNFG